ncbi:MAG: hypothetical protein BroJett018_46590 [Chloroflexota bacterium]|nr:MAG: hypothetical protein BroJett018_46590 [Chloroflexota bacterium]
MLTRNRLVMLIIPPFTVLGLLFVLPLLTAGGDHALFCGDTANAQDNPCLAAEGTVSAQQVLLMQATIDHLNYQIGLKDAAATITSMESQMQAVLASGSAPEATPAPYVPVADLLTDYSPSTGPEDAAVTLVEFSDYLCPYCARHHAETHDYLLMHYEGLLRYVYRDYPIIGGNATALISVAAHCMDDQGKYFEFADRVWANQISEEKISLDRTALSSLAAEIGADTTLFDACFTEGAAIDFVNQDYQAGQALGINGTPTFFVEGQRFVGAQPLSAFLDLIDAELVKKGITPPARD